MKVNKLDKLDIFSIVFVCILVGMITGGVLVNKGWHMKLVTDTTYIWVIDNETGKKDFVPRVIPQF